MAEAQDSSRVERAPVIAAPEVAPQEAVTYPASPAGHRLVPHTADCIVEAWGPGRAACVSEALSALVESFASGTGSSEPRPMPLDAVPAGPADQLVSLLEDLIYVMDVFSVVPVGFRLVDTEDGGITGEMDVVPVDEVEEVGPVPKAVSYHELSMTGTSQRGWRCRVLVDV